MKDFKSILTEFKRINLNERKAALATVVSVKGSSYRSPGARMLITEDGRWVGSISGGCLEGDALRKARNVMQNAQPLTVTYDTREESNQNLGIGLGCNGVIEVLIEPLLPSGSNPPLQLFEHLIKIKAPVILVTVFNGNCTGEKMLVDDNGSQWKKISEPSLTELVLNDVDGSRESRKSGVRTYHYNEKESEVFIEFIQPAISLILFGGGVDARPVSQLAQSLGWDVSITDECVAHIAPVFFPGADRLSLCSREWVDRDFDITPYTACVLMSHNYEYDRDVLIKLIRTPAPYIGILGPRKRFEKMLDEFAVQGLFPDLRDSARIHSPIGLDLGAEAADEIAISIIAEIQAKFTNRQGGFLKNSPGPIHQREPDGMQVRKTAFWEDNP